MNYFFNEKPQRPKNPRTQPSPGTHGAPPPIQKERPKPKKED